MLFSISLKKCFKRCYCTESLSKNMLVLKVKHAKTKEPMDLEWCVGEFRFSSSCQLTPHAVKSMFPLPFSQFV